MYRLEGVFSIFGIVPRCYIEVLATDMRSYYLLIAETLLYAAQELFETFTQGCASRQPQRQTGAYGLRESKQLELFAQLAMVAFLGLFEQHKILVEHFLFGERNAVNTYQLIALLIAAPVCTGKRCDFHGLYHARIGDMRATAQIGECTLGIGRYLTVFQFVYQLYLIRLAAVTEEFQSIGFRYILAYDGFLAGGQFKHTGLYTGYILGCKR